MSTTTTTQSLATLHADRLSYLRADSPVLGFNTDSIDPLHFPSPDYTRDLPPELDQHSDAFEKQSSTYYNFLSNLPANIPPPPPPPSHRRSTLSSDKEPFPLPPAVVPGLHKRASAFSIRKQTPNYTTRQSSLSPYSIPPLPQHPPPPVPDSVRNAMYFNSEDVGEHLGALLLRSTPSPTSPTASRFPEGIPEEPLAEQLEIQKERREGDPLFLAPVSRRTLRNSSSQVFVGSASRRDADTRSQVFLGVPSIRPPLLDTRTRNSGAYLNMPPSPSSHSRSSDDSSGSPLFTKSKRKLSSATESSAEGEVMTPATSPASGSFDHSIPPRPSVEPRRYSADRPTPSRASFEHGITNRASFEHVVAGRASFESMAENRPVVVVHRYADGHERVYRYMPRPRDGDGYDTEYERDDIKAPPTASRWSLGSSVVESVKTAKPGKDDVDGQKDKDNKDKDKGDKDKEKLGKKKRLASFMSRLTLAPHPYAPGMVVPGRWEDVEFVAPSPSRSRGRSIPISVRAEMMREKERKRQRQKEKEEAERELQKQMERDGLLVDEGLGGGDYVEETGNGMMMNEHEGDSHIEGEQQQYDPHLVEEENQDQDLGYALSSSMSLPSSPTQSHIVQAFAAFSTKSSGKGMRARANSTPLPFVVGAGGGGVEDEDEYECECECECGWYYEPIVHHPLVRTKPQARARARARMVRADSETNAYADANIYSDITANTNIDTELETLPYRLSLSFSEPFLPLPPYSPTPTQRHQYQPTHTNSNSIESNASSRITTGSGRTLPPTPGPTSPAFSTTSFTTPSSPLSSFKGYETSTSSGSWSAFNSHSNSPSNSSLLLGSGIGSKKTSRRSLGIRGFAARMLGVHSSNPSSDSNSNFNTVGDSSPSRSRSRSLSSSPIVNLYFGREYEDELTPYPFYRGSEKKEKSRKKEKAEGKLKEKRILVISGIEDGEEAAVRKWCEAFGEVKVFERRGKGCLVVDFKKASVADMVCRVQAQVYIRGAGSVNLSWYTKTMMKQGAGGL